MADPVGNYFQNTMGFSVPASQYIIQTQGINSIAIIRELTDERITTLCAVTRKPGGGEAGHVVSEPSEHRFKSLAFYIRHQDRVSRTFNWTNATVAELQKLALQKELEESKPSTLELPEVVPDLKKTWRRPRKMSSRP